MPLPSMLKNFVSSRTSRTFMIGIATADVA